TSLEEEYNTVDYSISYQTRLKSSSYLGEIATNYNTDHRNDNIDFFYMSNALETISNWFNVKGIDQKRDKRKFLDHLMSYKEESNPIKVIWYEVNDETNSYDIFTRLNIGKIKLTNSELIKALFLKSSDRDNFTEARILRELAHDWNILEQ